MCYVERMPPLHGANTRGLFRMAAERSRMQQQEKRCLDAKDACDTVKHIKYIARAISGHQQIVLVIDDEGDEGDRGKISWDEQQTIPMAINTLAIESHIDDAVTPENKPAPTELQISPAKIAPCQRLLCS